MDRSSAWRLHTVKKEGLTALKTYSNKPLRVTLADGAWVAAISLVITLMFLFVWYRLADTPSDERIYGMAIWQTLACCLAGQIVCEYTGINNMIAQSSIRYSKGTTLFDPLAASWSRAAAAINDDSVPQA